MTVERFLDKNVRDRLGFFWILQFKASRNNYTTWVYILIKYIHISKTDLFNYFYIHNLPAIWCNELTIQTDK